jgi:integrase
LRIGEALSLRWRDVDLARGTITVRAAKTDAGVGRGTILRGTGASSDTSKNPTVP